MSDQPDTPRNPVKEVRQALRWSQEGMARQLGCSRAAVWQWERKGALPRDPDVLDKLHKLAKQADWLASLVSRSSYE